MFFRKMDTSVAEFLRFVKERNAYYQAMEGAPTADARRYGLSGGDAAACPAHLTRRSLEVE
jgi:hypothetical protein